jgi:hypothetical protein
MVQGPLCTYSGQSVRQAVSPSHRVIGGLSPVCNRYSTFEVNILNPISADKIASVECAVTLVFRDSNSFYRNLEVKARNPNQNPLHTTTSIPQLPYVYLISLISIGKSPCV